jgi:hypothetical protein
VDFARFSFPLGVRYEVGVRAERFIDWRKATQTAVSVISPGYVGGT